MKASDVSSIIMLAGTSVITAAVYPRLPERMATHFDVAGHANGWMPRAYGAWIMPVVLVGTWLLVRNAARLARRPEWRAGLERSPVAVVGAILVAPLCALQLLMLRYSLPGGESFDMGRAVALVLAGLWLSLGLVIPRVRRNPFIGVRTAWTLTSDENWARTHRVAGYAMIASGAVAMCAAAAGGPVAYAIAFAAFLSGALVPALYSWVVARGRGA